MVSFHCKKLYRIEGRVMKSFIQVVNSSVSLRERERVSEIGPFAKKIDLVYKTQQVIEFL